MIKIDSHGSAIRFVTSVRMATPLSEVLFVLLFLWLGFVGVCACSLLVRNVISYGFQSGLAQPLFFIGGIAGAAAVVELLIFAVRFIASAIVLFAERSSLHEELFFEDEGYTSRYTAENGVTVEGRYSYAAVKKVITYKDHISIASPDQTSVFRLADITEGTAEELSAILAGKLGDRVTHK